MRSTQASNRLCILPDFMGVRNVGSRLIRAGADLSAVDRQGATPFLAACTTSAKLAERSCWPRGLILWFATCSRKRLFIWLASPIGSKS